MLSFAMYLGEVKNLVLMLAVKYLPVTIVGYLCVYTKARKIAQKISNYYDSDIEAFECIVERTESDE